MKRDGNFGPFVQVHLHSHDKKIQNRRRHHPRPRQEG